MSDDLRVSGRLFDLLHEGKEIKTKTCVCGGCDCEFFVPAYSDEFLPRFCCYCGMEFVSRRII